MQINAIWQKKTTDFSIYNIFKDNFRHINATKMISDACEKDIFSICLCHIVIHLMQLQQR